jgi:hypothetical protein
MGEDYSIRINRSDVQLGERSHSLTCQLDDRETAPAMVFTPDMTNT